MAILFQEKDRTFTLQTEKSTYQMKVDRLGVLLHTYFGAATDASDYSYRIVKGDHGYCSQLGDAVEDRTYSMDYYPQEYPVYGTGDFRITALRAAKAGCVPSLDLRYVGHEIRDGKYALPGLPAMFANPDDRDVQTLEITLKDVREELYVKLLYGVFEKRNIITRAAVIENRGSAAFALHRCMSMSLDFLEGGMDLIHFYGKHAMERQFEREAVRHGITEIGSQRGYSSHHHNPFVILCDRDASEDFGGCYGISLVYSGSYRIQAELDQFDSLRVTCGISDEEFVWNLEKGGSFTAPETVLCYSPDGLTGLSQCIQRAYLRNLIRSPWKDRKRPVLVNNWEGTYFDFNADKLLQIAEQAADIGLDMLVLDDGWFGRRDSDKSGLGDWYVNEKKLGCTLKELVDRINGLGLQFGIWVEPEMVSEDSDLYRAHPEWALTIPGRAPNRGRDQLVLDLSNREVVAYIKETLHSLLDSANIAYIKWDMNRTVDNVYSAADPKMSQGEIRHRFLLGLYEILGSLRESHPDLLLEGCAGGGGRFDAGMLYYEPQIWCSDNTDAIERLRIHCGTSFGYPMSAVSAHVSACPNHQNGRVVPFKTRGICAMQGSFGYELDLSRLSEEEKAEAKRQIRIYKDHCELFQQGDYYRLASPFENRDYAAWSYVSQDRGTASLSVVYTDQHANAKPIRIRWKGLAEDAVYDVDGARCTGAALMHGGMVLPMPACNYDSFMVCIHRIS